MPLVQTRGAASAQGFGEFAQATAANYIEEVFSTYLFTGTGSNQTITNNIDLSTKGGLVWAKCRSNDQTHNLIDTVRGGDVSLNSASTGANDFGGGQGAQSFTSTGFVTGGFSARTYVSWTFRKQPKFFDVVTYTGTGSNTTIAHSLGSVPGSIIVKRTDTTADWAVYHRSLANTEYLVLNSTAAKATGATWWNSTTPTSAVFSVGTDASVNASGATYVAYLFAHDAGGFGTAGTDNVISCGSFTSAGPSTDVTVTLGYEPQWIMVKNATVSADWGMYDVMRGMSNTNTAELLANKSNAETNTTIAYYPRPTATGFIAKNSLGADSGNNIIYIAIRRGPMKVPTLGTSVYNANPFPADAATNNTVIDPGFPVDLVWLKPERSGVYNWYWQDRLRGKKYLYSNATDAEVNSSTKFDYSNGYVETVSNSSDGIGWAFRRAPGFFDEVCYTGTGVATTQTHNLAAVPELMIVKRRNVARYWAVYASPLGATKWLELETVDPVQTDTMWNNTTPTASVFSIGTYNGVNGSGDTYVAYLFATCAGVSKVFSYTGNGSSQTINCGFTGGARFVLIKRTDSTGDWYVWDSARGIVAGNDPHLSLNTTAAEVTTDDSVDTDTTGFIVNQVAATNVNVSSATYIGLAVA